LAISLEVAEHIEKSRAKIFIKNLAVLSDVIVFSAAVPRQGGTHHVNEQWPGYWRHIFKKCGYELLDPFRPKLIWMDGIKSYYRQNIFLAVKRNLLKEERYKNLPAPPDFIILHKNIFRRHKPGLRIPYLIRKYIFKKPTRYDLT
jgi:hypothetical protein